MILRMLLSQIALMFLQICLAQYNNYGGIRSPNKIQNRALSSLEYSNSDEICESVEDLWTHRKQPYSKTSSEGDEDSECSCEKCPYPKPCCSKFCETCTAKGGNKAYSAPILYHTLPDPKLVYVQYAVPIVMYTLPHQKLGDKEPAVKTTQTLTTKPTTQTTKSKDNEDTPDSSEQTSKTSSTTKKFRLKSRSTRKLEPELERLTKTTTSRTRKLKQNSDITRLAGTPRGLTVKPHRKGTTEEDPPGPSDLPHLPKSPGDDGNVSQYYDYPDDAIKKKINDTRCKDAANCYSRNWNKEGEPVKLYIETNSSLMPLVRLRPTLARVKRRSMPTTPRYKLKALNDHFAKKLMFDLKNRQVLVLQNNNA